MWIIPNNHPLYSQCVQGMVGSREDFLGLLETSPHSLMWRSKPSPAKTWSRRWKRERWLQLLSGRMLKRSQYSDFMGALISYLAATPVNRSLMQEQGWTTLTTQGISGLTSGELSELLSRSCVSSRTSRDILIGGSDKSLKIWKRKVTEQRGAYSQRRKQAHLMCANEFLSWATKALNGSTIWPTPTVDCENQRNRQYAQGGTSLTEAAQWPTPTVHGNTNKPGAGAKSGTGLSTAVKTWPTPAARDWKDTPGMSKQRDHRELGRIDHLPRAVFHYDGLQDQCSPSSSGKSQDSLPNSNEEDSDGNKDSV